MSEHSITYGKHTIEFSIVKTKRKTLETRVYPDLSVVVRAPKRMSVEEIVKLVGKRAPWIIKHQIYYQDFLPEIPPRKFISGETHRYLGRQYRLKVIPNSVNNVQLKGGYLILNTMHDNPTYNEELLYLWYRKQAEKKFNDVLLKTMEKLGKYHIDAPLMNIKKMKRRWGSCNPMRGSITINLELIRAPSQCIEYVIMHELCHLKYTAHDKRYYGFLSRVMPDWLERKGRLKEVHLG